MSNKDVEKDIRVARVINERRLVLNKGSLDRIRGNERFIVFEIGPEIHDPDSNENLGKLELVKGKGKVIHVQERMCTIETYDYEMITSRHNPTLILDSVDERKVYKEFVNARIGDHARKIK